MSEIERAIEKMTTSEPTTGEIVRALRDAPNYNGMAGTTTTVEDIAADRLERQERELSGITGELERFRAFHERYAEQTSKKYVNDICALTARAEQERNKGCDFCHRGKPIKAHTYLPDCGLQYGVSVQADFCPKCGRRLPEGSAE